MSSKPKSSKVGGASSSLVREQDARTTFKPKLRFPEFRDAPGWISDNLDTVAEFVGERIPLDRVKVENYVSTENILPDFSGVTTASKLPSTGSATHFKINDVLISNIRPYLKKVWFSNKDGGSSNDVIVVRAKAKLLIQFLPFILKNDSFIDYIMTGAKGVKMPRGDVSLIKKYPITYPNHLEQQKIADCLTSLDESITAQAQKLDALKTHKKSLMQQLFPCEGETQPCIRFPEFQDAPEWQNRQLDEFISERSQQDQSQESLPLFSLTIEKGVTPKTERYERSFLVADVEEAYKVVWPNDFAFNPMNLRFGAIARHSGESKVMLSKYYNIFYCNQSVDSRFCEIYFKSDSMITFYDNMAAGSLIEKRRVHFNDFVGFRIRFPSLLEQQRIADCLYTLDELIVAQTEKLEVLKAHKQGLMQQLFPSPEEVEA